MSKLGKTGLAAIAGATSVPDETTTGALEETVAEMSDAEIERFSKRCDEVLDSAAVEDATWSRSAASCSRRLRGSRYCPPPAPLAGQ